MTATDTIFALSTGAGRAAIAVIRVSGPASSVVLTAMAGKLPRPRELAVCLIRHPATGEGLDEALVAWLPGPRSFTGEDCAELHIHASPAVISGVMAALGSRPGVRPAEAGEFTRRAFLNGKMDLVEVEGLSDLLEARTEGQRRQAFRQMSGLASTVFGAWRQQLLQIRADIEAVVDFVDEPGVAEEAAPGIDQRISALLTEAEEALLHASTAEVVRDGVRVVLAGAPNTGKSSLLNALARREAAIVSAIPGTTRDAIEVSLDMHGIPVLLTDTAGLREEGADIVEEEGIRRSHRLIGQADIVVWVWSLDVPASEDSGDVAPDLIVQNKCDLESGLFRNDPIPGQLRLSTRTGSGFTSFVESLSELLTNRYGSVESSLVVSERQASATRNLIRLLNDALSCSTRLELKAEAIRMASDEVGRLTGRVDVEEWLGAIFSRFCVGK